MGAKMPKISFVMPQRNRDDLILESINSIISQTEKDWELIVVDDHSDAGDKTEEVINKIDDDRITFVKMPSKWPAGIPNARNFGNMFAKSPIIAVADSDDISKPKRAEITLECFNKEDFDIFFSNYEIYKKTENITIKPKHEIDKFRIEFLNDRNCIPHPSSAYKREIVYLFPYNSFFGKGEDYDLFLRLARAGKKFSYSKEVLLRYVVHENSITGGKKVLSADNLIKLNNGIEKHNRDDVLQQFINETYN